MIRRLGMLRTWPLAAAAAGAVVMMAAPAAAGTPRPGATFQPVISPVTEFSKGCPGQNNELEQAAGPHGYVYEEWMGCNNRIAVATSANGGLTFHAPVVVPSSLGGWDPSVAVASDGTVYVGFMTSATYHARRDGKRITFQRSFPVVAVSFDHGRTFPRITKVVPRQRNNWGDRDFLATGSNGTVYLTWDYGPWASKVTFVCAPNGSCGFSTGDLNVVLQKSVDHARTFGPITPVSPGFPASGGDSAPMVVVRGKVYAEYQGYHILNRTTFAMKTAHSFVTSSANGGRTWSAPVRVGPARLTMNTSEWWIDGAISADTAGNLYVTWDTQVGGRDVGWLSYSTDHGRNWSRLFRVNTDTDNATHIVEVAGGRRGIAYVGWLADNSPRGYALNLRPFSISRGWLSAPIRVSPQFGNAKVWPGDTFGISAIGPLRNRVVVSWGSAVGGTHAVAQDRAAVVTF